MWRYWATEESEEGAGVRQRAEQLYNRRKREEQQRADARQGSTDDPAQRVGASAATAPVGPAGHGGGTGTKTGNGKGKGNGKDGKGKTGGGGQG